MERMEPLSQALDEYKSKGRKKPASQNPLRRDLPTKWRNISPKLKELDIAKFRHMRICCPHCVGTPAGCKWCNDTGLCCPKCRGLGWLAKRYQGEVADILRCPICHLDMSDGAEFDAANTMRAILRYVDEWFAGTIPDEVLTHQKRVEQEACEAAATRTHGGKLWKHG